MQGRLTFLTFLIITLLCSATEKIVSKARQLVNVKKDDGFAALHLSALNGHREVADTLITLVRPS